MIYPSPMNCLTTLMSLWFILTLLSSIKWWNKSAINVANWFGKHKMQFIYSVITTIILSVMQCSRNVMREATHMGHHMPYMHKNLRWSMIMFITLEILIFLLFFWACFHNILSLSPKDTTSLNPSMTTLLNTNILLTSSVTVTFIHHNLLNQSRTNSIQIIIINMALGLYFISLHTGNYMKTALNFADKMCESTFFITTSFYGTHILIGLTFLLVCLNRVISHFFFTNQFVMLPLMCPHQSTSAFNMVKTPSLQYYLNMSATPFNQILPPNYQQLIELQPISQLSPNQSMIVDQLSSYESSLLFQPLQSQLVATFQSYIPDKVLFYNLTLPDTLANLYLTLYQNSLTQPLVWDHQLTNSTSMLYKLAISDVDTILLTTAKITNHPMIATDLFNIIF